MKIFVADKTRKLLLNLVQTSMKNKWYIKQNLQIH